MSSKEGSKKSESTRTSTRRTRRSPERATDDKKKRPHAGGAAAAARSRSPVAPRASLRLDLDVEYSLGEIAALAILRPPQVMLAIEGTDAEDGASVSLRVCPNAADALRRLLDDSAAEREVAGYVDATMGTKELRVQIGCGHGSEKAISAYTISHLTARDHAPLRAALAAADIDLRDSTAPTQRATE
jgi:hypothetical protein